VSQCPIAPLTSKTYRFRADMYGTSWYHSHYSAQYAGGALGPMVIHGPKYATYDVDLGPIILSDWYHQDYFTLVNQTMNGGVPLSNNNLINGKMNYPCVNTTQACTPNAGISKFNFQSGKKYLLRLINTSAEGIQKFSLDGHTFTVVANDFVPIKPYTTNVITLGVGQRSDVVVTATGTSGQAYWMRSDLGNLGAGCSVTDGVSPEAVAAVYYQGANTNAVPTTTSSVTTAQLTHCGNDPLASTVALCALTPDPNPPTVQDIDITFGSNGTNFVWFMNNSTFRVDYNDPVLQDANQGITTFPQNYNVFNFGSASSVRLIVRNFFQFGAHPMHVSLPTLEHFSKQHNANRHSFTVIISMSWLKV
jgi:FtsP/CotA-like multicopper oxidase with cupredoxin domain